jgi:hypothetical protein
MKQHRRNWKEYTSRITSDRIPKEKILRHDPEFWNTSDMMQEFCFVI